MNQFDMSDMYLYFGDILNVLVKKFDIKSIHNGIIAFDSLLELKEFKGSIYSSTIYIFDEIKHENINLNELPVFGNSNIYFTNKNDVYQQFRDVDLERLMTSIIINCDNLYNLIISNSVHGKIKFYIPKVINKLDSQQYINLKPPVTLT